MNTEITPAQSSPSLPVTAAELTIPQLVDRVRKISDAIRAVCVPGVDMLTLPGVKKPIATKSFAEKIATLFMFSPTFAVVVEKDGDHREVTSTCTLIHTPTGAVVASCVGSCSTMESKYRWRAGERTCPKCSVASIRKSKDGGFYCWSKIGGCGAKFADNDQTITGQALGRVENPDIADTYNTVSKIAQKRSFVGAVLIASGASAHATQDEGYFAPETEHENYQQPDMMPRAKAAPAADDIPFTPATPITTPVASKSNAPPATADRVKVVIKTVDVGSGNTNGKPWTRYRFTLAEVDPAGTPFEATTFSSTIGEELRGAVGMEGVAILTKESQGVKLWGMEPC